MQCLPSVGEHQGNMPTEALKTKKGPVMNTTTMPWLRVCQAMQRKTSGY